MAEFEIRVTFAVPELPPRFDTTRDFAVNAADQVRDVLKRHWPLIPWTVGAVTPTGGEPCLKLNTGDPYFDPARPVTVNGFRYIPAPRAVATVSPGLYQQRTGSGPGGRYVAPPRADYGRETPGPERCATPSRREGDEHVCTTCALRWAVTEDKPRCPRLKGI